MADGLADDFGAAAIVAFGASFLAAQSGAAFREERVAELEIALAAEAVTACGFDAGTRTALAFDQHGQLTCDLIVFGDGQGSVGADEGVIRNLERHGWTSVSQVIPTRKRIYHERT